MFAYIIAFLSHFCYAVTNVVDSYISNSVFKRIESVIFYCVISNVLVIPFLFFFGMPELPPISILPFLLIAALLDVLYLVPHYIAMRHIDTSIAAALFCLGKSVVPILAFLMLGEKVSLFLFNELFNQLGVMCANYALMMIPVVVYTAITSTQPCFVLLRSFLVTSFSQHQSRENFDKWAVIKKLVCFAFMIIGVVLAI